METFSDSHRFALALPITQQARSLATQFGQAATLPEKAQQIRLNTIAVLVVRDYLQLMGIASNLSQSDSWNPIVRLMANVAALALPELGRLECRPVLVGASDCSVPPEVWHERIGYVFVQIDESIQTAWLLGFVPSVQLEQIQLDQLQSPEALLEHLEQLRSRIQPTIERLSEWVQSVFGAGWEAIDAVLNPLELGFAFRGEIAAQLPNAIRRAKQIDLKTQASSSEELLRIALVIELTPQANAESNICLQVYPIGQTTLPPNLQLVVSDESGKTFLEAQSRQHDNGLQLRFQGQGGEPFAVSIVLGNSRVTEQFII